MEQWKIHFASKAPGQIDWNQLDTTRPAIKLSTVLVLFMIIHLQQSFGYRQGCARAFVFLWAQLDLNLKGQL